jgi:hypothetical protein
MKELNATSNMILPHCGCNYTLFFKQTVLAFADSFHRKNFTMINANRMLKYRITHRFCT